MQLNPTSDHINKINNANKTKIKPIYILIGFVIISGIVAFIIGGIMLGKDRSHISPSEDERSQIDVNSIPDNPTEWQSYGIESIGMEIKLPENLSNKGEWKEQIIPGEKGSILCFSNKTSQGANCTSEILIIGGSSTDFSEGRGGMFTDLQGFRKENGKYFIKTTGGNEFELISSKNKKLINTNGVEIIKILGETNGTGTPQEGYIGAIVNTKNSKYPGISVQLKLSEGISEYEFDQILESLKFTN